MISQVLWNSRIRLDVSPNSAFMGWGALRTREGNELSQATQPSVKSQACDLDLWIPVSIT